MNPFPFVVGCERSGTTLLRAMLDSHPQLAVPPESYFLTSLIKDEEPFEVDKFLSAVGEHRRFPNWSLPIEDVRTEIEKSGANDLAEAVRALYRAYANSRGKERWGDKTPGYVKHLRPLANLLPEAHFIHIIRDGRDVTLSWLETPFGPTSVVEAAERWRKEVRAGRRAGNQHLSDRYIEVRYERLVANPEKVLGKVCKFLDLPFDPAMLAYPQKADEIIDSTMRPTSHQRLKQAPTSGVRDWHRDMKPDDVQAFQEIAGDFLAKLGYELV